MDFDHSPKVKALQKKLDDFMGEFIYPNQQRYRASGTFSFRTPRKAAG